MTSEKRVAVFVLLLGGDALGNAFAMKNVIAFIAFFLTAFAAALAQTGGGYDLTWSTIDGGGITVSTGGGYELGGTMGQPDAGIATGGGYELAGGFWPGALAGTPALGDCDGDGDVDLDDYAGIPDCLAGPVTPAGPECGCLDADADSDVDLADFAVFQANFTGS